MWLRAAANWRELIPGITSIFSFGKFLSLAILKTVFKTPENPGSPVDNIDTVLPSIAKSTPFSSLSNKSFTLNASLLLTSSNKSIALVLPTV